MKSGQDAETSTGEIIVWLKRRPSASSRLLIGPKATSLGYRLLVAQGGMADTEAGLDLWRLPAVVNVGPASRIIQTGQTVCVDGHRGTVTVLGNA